MQQARVEPLSVTGEYREREWFEPIHDGMDSSRNSCVVAHRRSGKTVGTIAQVIRDTFAVTLPRPQAAFIAPTQDQARKVALPYFEDMLGGIPGVRFAKHESTIYLPNDGRIFMASGEKYDRLRGLYLDVAAVDEMADCPAALIPQVLRPALEDRSGKLRVIGTVKGAGPFWKLYQSALESPDWHAALATVDDTRVFTRNQIEYLQREMSPDEFAQEMLCDPNAAVRGAYYAERIRELKAAGQVCRVPYDESLSVCAAFDLGIADATAVWLVQLHRAGEIRSLEYREYQNTGFMQILRELQQQPFQITRWIGPHDLAVREFTTGQRRVDAAREVGVSFEIAPRLPVIEGIEAVRRALPRCWFDAIGCSDGLDALALYRSSYDETRRVLSRNPVHDWTCHAADAFRYLVLGTDGGRPNVLQNMPELNFGD